MPLCNESYIKCAPESAIYAKFIFKIGISAMKKLLAKMTAALYISILLFTNSSYAVENSVMLKPFTLAKIYKNTTLIRVESHIKKQLSAAGFKVVGTYEPYKTVKVIIVTNAALLKTATKSKYGGFGAGIRISLSQTDNNIQVSHNNPTYMGIAFNMKSNLSSTRKKLADTLGYIKDFGGEGIASSKLAHYNYSIGLEGFNGFMDLAEHKSHKAALKSVEAGFARNFKNMKKVYRIDIPGKKQSIFGISLKNDKEDQKFLNDHFVMEILDDKELRRSAHLPYELMVIGKRVIIMHPHYRIAINFPDLRMFGKHSFGNLMDLPYVYEEFMIQLAGGVWPIPEDGY